jgi:queuine/archaeosine tRNA-ribosyltransferase
MQGIRDAIEAGRFDDFKTEFTQKRTKLTS